MLDREQLGRICSGAERPGDLASIVIPHYQTEDLVRLCLRAIRRSTDHPYEVIVVDNHSRDGSLQYLRSVGWIRLIERGEAAETEAAYAHASAMDAGAAAAHGRWLVSFHTDTIVRRRGWLGVLLARLQATPNAAALGSGKISYDPAWYRGIKRVFDEQRIKAAFRRLVGTGAGPKPGALAWYPRSYCALYRLDLVREFDLTFQPVPPNHPAGERLYHGLLDAGYTGVAIPPEEMNAYVEHVSHATALIGRGGVGHWRGNQKVRRVLKRIMDSDVARDLMRDDSLDR